MVQQQKQQDSDCDHVTKTTLSSKKVTSSSPYYEEEKHEKKNNQPDTHSPLEEDKNMEGDQEVEEDQEPHTSDATACVDDQNEDQDQNDGDDMAEVRRLIAKGMPLLSYQERYQIEEEVHGIQSMGLSQGEEAKPYAKALFLQQFQDHLESTLILARKMKDEAKRAKANTEANPEIEASSPSLSTNESTITSNTDVYEWCLRKNYTYATNESGSLRLMCLRAVLWNPKKACTKFLNHLNALHKYYGDTGLKEPLSIERLDYKERNCPIATDVNNSSSSSSASSYSRSNPSTSRGIYKKGNGSCKRKGSLESLPDMLELKSGIAQVLPSRDRCGRRVVFLQPAGLSIDSHTQTQQQQQHHSKLKSMLYFFSSLAQSDIDVQRKGLVLIINSTKIDATSSTHKNSKDQEAAMLNEYKELFQAVSVRFSAIHLCVDDESVNSIPHKISMTILRSFIGNNPTMNIARIRLYDQDTSYNDTKNKIISFGIPVHQIPITHTGTIKLKEHYQWIKVQEWSEKRRKTNSKLTIIECPGINDVLFSQGGKYWNGVNRFQRGNLEFMEFLESKIDVYQSTLSWKKKHTILTDLVTEFAGAFQSTGEKARFLETGTQSEGIDAPDGCWVELPLESPLLMQKIRQALLNHNRRLEASGKRRPVTTKIARVKPKQESINIKKRKFVHDSLSLSHSIMKNKLAAATFGDSIDTETLNNQQTICEFLTKSKHIEASTAVADNDCDSIITINGDEILYDSIDIDEKIVQSIIANDERLNREVGKLFEMDSFLQDEEIGKDQIADFIRSPSINILALVS